MSGVRLYTLTLVRTSFGKRSSGVNLFAVTPCACAKRQNASSVLRFSSSPYGKGSSPKFLLHSPATAAAQGTGMRDAVKSWIHSRLRRLASSKALNRFIAVQGYRSKTARRIAITCMMG